MVNSISVPTFYVKQTNVISYVKNRPSKRNSSNSKSKNYRHYTPREHTTPADIPQIKKILPLDWEAMHFTEDFVISFLDKGGKFYKKLFWENAPTEVKNFIEETGVTPNELYVWWKNNLTEMPICPACGNVVRLFGNYYELHTFCSSKCAKRRMKEESALSKKKSSKKAKSKVFTKKDTVAEPVKKEPTNMKDIVKGVKAEAQKVCAYVDTMSKVAEIERLLIGLTSKFFDLKKSLHM